MLSDLVFPVTSRTLLRARPMFAVLTATRDVNLKTVRPSVFHLPRHDRLPQFRASDFRFRLSAQVNSILCCKCGLRILSAGRTFERTLSSHNSK